ncbi:MAG: aldehyde dehydrogenase [Hyphococcus sp.]|nr:MAG: aldehyde dehydrogenase [Marinicaulis sp.]
MPADTARSLDADKSEGEREIERIFALQKKAYGENPFPSYDRRVAALDKITRLLEVNEDRFVTAINADFGNRSKYETIIAEVMTTASGVKNAKKNLKKWMRPRGVATPLHMLPAKSKIEPQPLGVIGIIAPWNYPVELALAPAAAALAAGNRVMIKPSELTPRAGEAMRDAIAAEFDESEVAVITGGIETGQAFSETPFDHLLFTGSTAIGTRVAQAAAKNLTPVTLELGGKSPVILDKSADMEKAARSVAYGKAFNAGQTCIAPDYVLAPTDQLEAFVESVARNARELYPEIDKTSDYTAIISDRHFDRLKSMVEEVRDRGAKIVEVGSSNALHPQRKLPLTLIIDPPRDSGIMKEEIFGPILPILPVASPEDAIAHVNAGDRPLALYWYGEDDDVRDQVLQKTVSGGVTVNDTLWHFAQENLPFGGVGKSGSGAYHGEAGFVSFSHMKPVFYQSRFSSGGKLQPPFGPHTEKVLSLVRKII